MYLIIPYLIFAEEAIFLAEIWKLKLKIRPISTKSDQFGQDLPYFFDRKLKLTNSDI
jgi:hypothetical protein